MPRLTDTQLIILSKAAQDEGHIVTLPDKLKGGAAKKVVGKLLDLQLVEEIAAARDMPVWRHDDDDRPLALRVTATGLEAIGVAAPDRGVATASRRAAPNKRARKVASGTRRSRKLPVADDLSPKAKARPGRPSKQASVIALLQRKSGATIGELTGATGWLPHSTRAALSGLRKRGFVIETDRTGKSGTRYRITGTPAGGVAASGSGRV